jgi:DNA-binding response OmpR family regulator
VKRVLVVENEQSIRAFCHVALQEDGFEVDTAADGREAQGMMDALDYDIFLIDLKMPVFDGMQLFRWMKVAHPTLTDRVTFTSGDTMAADTRNFIATAGRPFLPKPFTLNELRTAVKVYLQTSAGAGSK